MNNLEKQSDLILKNSGLSVTSSRKKILEVFLNANTALEHQDIEKIATQYDRVTIYRTLQTFLDKGIIHPIPTTDNSIKYAVCSETCVKTGHHHDNHVHFFCDKCGKTECLDDVAIPSVILPSGYDTHEINMVVNGTCKTCRE